MRLDPAKKAAWVAALRSGKYRQQDNGNLRDPEGFCCLGVACDIAQDLGALEIEYDIPSGLWYHGSEYETEFLPPEMKRWLGISATGVFEFGYPVPDRIEKHETLELTVLNDNWGLTFDQIADMIDYFM